MQKLLLLTAILLPAGLLSAAQHGGIVRSAGQPVPGATVTATLADQKFVTATDENGNYVFQDLPPGAWKIEVEIFGFTIQARPLSVGAQATTLDWELELRPRAAASSHVSPPAASSTAAAPKPAAAAGSAQVAAAPAKAKPAVQGNPNRGRNPSSQGVPNQPDFVTLSLNPQAEVANTGSATEPAPPNGDDYAATEAFLVTGSLSTGLQDARRDQAREDRLVAGGVGYPGMGMGPGLGMGMGDPTGQADAMGPGLAPGRAAAGAWGRAAAVWPEQRAGEEGADLVVARVAAAE